MTDKTVIHHCALGRYIECLPSSYAAIGDAAYEPMEHITPIFYGVNWSDPLYDNFNFFASQLCIQIEMAFGLMQMKWCYLLQPRQVTTHLPQYIIGIAFLHNFVVNYRLQNGDVDSDIFQDLQDDTTTTEGRMPPSQPEDRNGNPLMYNNNGQTYQLHIGRGVSLLRHQMALKICELGLQRPVHSRRNNDDNE